MWSCLLAPTVQVPLPRHRQEALKRCFDTLDVDGSGSIDEWELTTALHMLGFSDEVNKTHQCVSLF